MAKKKEETVKIDEEDVKEESERQSWTEEFVVAGEELVGFVKNLVKETTVRHITIKNEKHGINLHFPLALGVVGIALLPFYSAVALIAALVTDCKILVERTGSKEPATE
jgi:hypothetical protein